MFYGVDIGGTKTEIVAFDKEMQVCWRKRVATPVQDYELFLSTFTSLIDTADWATGTQGKLASACPVLWTDIPENYCHLTCLALLDAR